MPIDPDQVRAMARWGAPRHVVAQRLGCTPRHLRRLTREHGIEWGGPYSLSSFWGDPDPLAGERAILWTAIHALHPSAAAVAYRVGRSRQAVHAWLAEQRSAPRTVPANPNAWQGTPSHQPTSPNR